MKLTRLTDRIETDKKTGEEIITKRFGIWGTTAEVDKTGRNIRVILPDKQEVKFRTLEEAEVYMIDLVKL